MIAAAEARRRPSASNLNRHRSPSRLMSGSNPSLESQLAQDFQRHAPFAASSSATSLGRHGASHLSLHDSMPPVPPVPSNYHGHVQGSAPPSPYGHPNAAAVAHGAGLGRQVLPSISQWDQDVNPIFRVVSPFFLVCRTMLIKLATCSTRWEWDYPAAILCYCSSGRQQSFAIASISSSVIPSSTIHALIPSDTGS